MTLMTVGAVQWDISVMKEQYSLSLAMQGITVESTLRESMLALLEHTALLFQRSPLNVQEATIVHSTEQTFT